MNEENDKEARNKLIEHNLRLVAHIIKKYYSVGYDQEDLISIGTIGLIKAIDSFDILFLDGDTDNPKIGWIDKNGNPVILKDEKADLSEVEADVEALESAMAEKANASDVETLETALATKVTAEEVNTMIKESGDSFVEIVEF